LTQAIPIPKFGMVMSFEARVDKGESSEHAYRDALEFAREADRIGIEVIWCPEHHGEESGYIPSPLVGAAAISAATKTCRVGTGIALAPLYGHPLRLLEDCVTVDNLSGGRLDIGLGQGYRPHEYEAVGLPYKRRARAFEETLEILQLAWRGDEFNYDGEIYKTRGGRLRPKPIQPRVPVWIGATTTAARARVVRHRAGLNLSPLSDFESTARHVASFDRLAAEAGVGPLPRAVGREILLGDSPKDAVERSAEFMNFIYRVQYTPERTGMTYVDSESGQRVPLTSDHPYYLSQAFIEERWWVGRPDAVARQIIEEQKRLRLDVIVFTPRMPGMSVRRGLEELEMVMKEVAPRVRHGVSELNRQTEARV
jgi:alkanesulfonate monooxygenase SsuD/methylene tetrahydromethanopterin reductase-like flavin-dependent oxidoreductase (luciferase family)